MCQHMGHAFGTLIYVPLQQNAGLLELDQLSCLTYLSLHCDKHVVGYTVAAALASSLPLLRHLKLSKCQLPQEQ
jgi:hypothetical protein